jgi:hypothetical protein
LIISSQGNVSIVKSQVILKPHRLLTINIVTVGVVSGYDGYLSGLFCPPQTTVFFLSIATKWEEEHDEE